MPCTAPTCPFENGATAKLSVQRERAVNVPNHFAHADEYSLAGGANYGHDDQTEQPAIVVQWAVVSDHGERLRARNSVLARLSLAALCMIALAQSLPHLAPDNSIGTITIVGNATLNPGSVSSVEVRAPDQSNRLLAAASPSMAAPLKSPIS